MSNNIQISNLIISLLEQFNVSDVCICPGARNAPMIDAFSKSCIQAHSILDERSAGFYALGIAKKTNKAVAISCTSGTALANLFPAIIEARMSEIPIIIISADRPVQLIDTGENQTIYQDNIYGTYSLHFEKINSSEYDLDSICNKINITLQASLGIIENQKLSSKGPVHINVHFDKPLIDSEKNYKHFDIHLKKIEPQDENFNPIKNKNLIKRPLIICGQSDLKQDHKDILEIAHQIGAPILSDISSNINGDSIISFYDQFIDHMDSPDLILRFGKKPLSKKLLTLINQNKEITYLVRLREKFNDDANQIEVPPDYFLKNIQAFIDYKKNTTWLDSFIKKDALAKEKIESLSKNNKMSEYSFASCLINKLPDNSNVFIGNSLIIRAFDAFNNQSYNKDVHILTNRGVSGIDGNIATALGIAAVSNKNNYLVIGDQSFMHDVGSLQIFAENNINLTIFIINNGGGAIFDQLPLSEKMNLDAFNKFIRRNHNQNFKSIVKSYDMGYKLISTTDQLDNLQIEKKQIYEIIINSKDSLELI